MWEIDPATQVVESSKIYRRSVEKEKVHEMVDEDISEERAGAGGRILGIDYGQRRVGLAVSDPLGITAQGLETIQYTNEEELFVQLDKVIDAYEVAKIVVGLPLRLDGTPGEKVEEVHRFVEHLRDRFRGPVITWDERMTTTAAHRTMHEMGGRAKGAKGKVDRIAAMLILQNYLDRVRTKNG